MSFLSRVIDFTRDGRKKTKIDATDTVFHMDKKKRRNDEESCDLFLHKLLLLVLRSPESRKEKE